MAHMQRSSIFVAALTLSTLALASNPPGSPPLGGSMSHVLVTVFSGAFYTAFESPHLVPVTMQGPGSGYTGNAAVLNDTHFNAQYGWLVSGFWAPPTGASVWILVVDQSPGLRCYLGRSVFGATQFTPIFGTDGSTAQFRWDGAMLHNYYAVTTLGDFDATYEIYYGDATGVPIAGGATPSQITLEFHFGNPDVNDDAMVDAEDLYSWHAAQGVLDTDENGQITDLDRSLLVATLREREAADVLLVR